MIWAGMEFDWTTGKDGDTTAIMLDDKWSISLFLHKSGSMGIIVTKDGDFGQYYARNIHVSFRDDYVSAKAGYLKEGSFWARDDEESRFQEFFPTQDQAEEIAVDILLRFDEWFELIRSHVRGGRLHDHLDRSEEVKA